ncbi:pimeloyl-ACP methyl ester carboxylesterase [Saccharothrix tamanrassetensis]|uniref:Pimeloyl-ACP methyl ester carboxylesterase n=1 Tax=Saccharothrix tamanrassetensis TaxID=1051531 RepID=A0A841CDK6_9PSEU|nr:hypothetical protein [Saccharothrix tamanrassetensis]MBB5955043.1 pimeloyl-ACP methyl ester carboxylesterase [Saccharothrix tamanrassetensis]
MKRLGVLLLVVCALLGLAVPASASVRRYEGEIGGAAYRVMVPSDWNGTLVLWSHGAYGAPPSRIALTDQPATEDYLLARGFALAGSQFRTTVGWSLEDGLRDQIALLDWFRRTVGTPRRTISAGESVGGATATVLAERNPRRFDGVLTLCGAVGGGASYWNSGLDVMFAVKTLLGVDIELVEVADPEANQAKAFQAIEAAGDDPVGRARIALAGALGDLPGWFDPTAPRPTGLVDQLHWTRVWAQHFRTGAVGVGRADLERWAGGNPSWNIGVDYRRVLERSSEKSLVRQAYAAAGLDLDADLARLAGAPRVTADPSAVAYLARTSLPIGVNPWPVVTVHNVADGLLPISNQTAYRDRVHRESDLRQYPVDRAGHCRFTASEEITAFGTLFDRLADGAWPATDPATLNTAASAFGPDKQVVRNPLTGEDAVVRPAFSDHRPGPYPRPLPF